MSHKTSPHSHHHHHHHHQMPHLIITKLTPDQKKERKKLNQTTLAKLSEKACTHSEEWIRPTNGEEAWKELVSGNERFASGNLQQFLEHIAHESSLERRQELISAQHPFATVITCSDSRVSPELIFDQGLGDIFVIRVAGNVLDEITIGSVEYGVYHLNTQLVVIMGHQFCGAVTATLDSVVSEQSTSSEPKPEVSAYVNAILKEIKPAAKEALETHKDDRPKALDEAIQKNVKNQRDSLFAKLSGLKDLISSSKLKVVGCVYNLEKGKVDVLF